MKIKEFIQQEILLPRLKRCGVLVLYDPARRYRELCLELASEKRRVIDASQSSITSRAAALREFGQPNPALEGILIYAPVKAPATDEEKQRDPFAVYGACGAVFPESDGDEYLSLCLRARPDFATEIRRVFKTDPNPGFAVIDAVGGGAGWPNLQARLGVESTREILFALLTPSIAQLAALKEGAAGVEAWAEEVRRLCQSALGLKFSTRANSWDALADELWRCLLYSEFVFDLQQAGSALPSALADVPRAPAEARPAVEDLCDWLRRDTSAQTLYIERAVGIEKDLGLPAFCQKIEDFGVRDTFPFEERACFNQAVDALQRGSADRLRHLLARHGRSVWVGRGENQSQWNLLQAAASLVQACEDARRLWPECGRSLEALVEAYLANLREVDRLQREFEQAASDALGVEGNAAPIIQQARLAYRDLAEKMQHSFLRQVEKSGWPMSSRLANAAVFDKLVAPRLMESGRRVALFLIDAARYELGVELARQLDEEGQVEVQAACAQLPTATLVGMASLLPGAAQNLRLTTKDAKLTVILDEQPLTSAAQRMEVLRKRYGQRFAEMDLAKFIKQRPSLDSVVELLALRSNEMDNDFESNPEAAPALISRAFQRIRSALHHLAGLGFQDAFILTDHGFFLNPAPEAGDSCAKPSGQWVNTHERMLLGDGSGDSANLVLPVEMLGIRGDFPRAAAPRALVAYRAGLTYFHGGLSLQEALVPVISVRLRAPEKKAETLSVLISYKHEARKITTRLPVVEVSLAGQGSLFGGEDAVEILLEAHDLKGQVVGEAKPGGAVNPATRLITLKPGVKIAVTIKMQLDFEGKFVLKALAPATLTALGKPLELETDYTV